MLLFLPRYNLSGIQVESAVKTVESALLYGIFDADSLVNLHSRLHGSGKELPPLSLGGSVPSLRPVMPNLAAYDASLNRKGGVPQC